jgi:alkaline phosphatase
VSTRPHCVLQLATCISSRLAVAILLALGLLVLPAAAAGKAKNVIIMISDGAGFNTWNATSMYQGKWDSAKGKSTQVYDGPGWVNVGCSTYPLNTSRVPTKTTTQDASLVYNPQKAWATGTVETKDGRQFAAYKWLSAATDSAAAGTALASGVKTFNHAINWSNQNQPLTGRTSAEIAHAAGKSVGTITTVFWTDATPATLGGAHNVDRANHAQIGREMLAAPYLDVIMGAGNPDFDDDGQPKRGKADDIGGADVWAQLKAGTHPAGWKLIQSKAEFEALTSGPTSKKVVGTAQVHSTLQQARSKYQASDVPFARPLNTNVPTLAVMRSEEHTSELQSRTT